MSKSALHTIKTQWKTRIFLKCLSWVLLAGGLGILIAALGEIEWYWIVGLVSIAFFFIVMELRQLPTQHDLISLINQQYDSAEYSADLLFQIPEGQLQLLQQQRVNAALAQRLPSFHYPIYWKDLFIAGVVMVLAIVGVNLLNSKPLVETSDDFVSTSEGANDSVIPPSDSIYLSSYRIYTSPPFYTGIRTKKESSFDFSIPENGEINWELKYNGVPATVWIRLSDGDSLASAMVNGVHKIRLKAAKSSLYTVNYLAEDGATISSPYYELQVIPDVQPEIVVTGIPPFQRLDYRENLSVNMNVSISDDYGLSRGHIVATITKGSGESVKFREQQIDFPGNVTGKKIVYPISFDLDALDMEPGNELYFYVTAYDNKEPKAQQTRTDTYFIVLKDTAEVEFSLEGSLGVDLMPDFFRSQLQIILDTKKLIEDKSTLTEQDFNFASNALGYDQKQLRLKYGQFIGEEEDSGLEVQDQPIEISGDADNVLAELGHDTDAENEEGQWMDRGTEDHDNDHEHDHDHGSEEGGVADANSLLEEFMHNHEDEETATFYTQSLKSKLRAALSEMWDAELYLRLFKPKQSLPYQLKAQELLKEIRNHARIYVQRIGFDPPPVNVAESRLTGKLKQLNENSFKDDVEKETVYPAIRKAIQWIAKFRFEKVPWDNTSKGLIQSAGDELAGLAVENPGKYLSSLNLLKKLLDKDELNDADIIVLKRMQKVMEAAIPKERILPQLDSQMGDEYTDAFIESLTNATIR